MSADSLAGGEPLGQVREARNTGPEPVKIGYRPYSRDERSAGDVLGPWSFPGLFFCLGEEGKTMKIKLSRIKDILKDIRSGKMVVVVDDPSRENEGDIITSAARIDSRKVNFMAKFARGLICVPMEESSAERLDLHMMSSSPQDPYKTAWAVSVDARKNVTTGISASDRAETIRVLSDPSSSPEDLVRPGHVFPLRSRAGGVLVRAGHTEAGVDLMKLAGEPPVAVICEIMNEDGTMARMKDLVKFKET